MNQTNSDRWKALLLDQIFSGLATSPQLCGALVFKGARVLNLRLNTHRQSLDIDSNLTFEFAQRISDRNSQRKFLDENMSNTLRLFFNRQDPQRFSLESLKVVLNPECNHPWNWNAFSVKIRIADRQKSRVRNLPCLEIDIAAPEELSPHSVGLLHMRNQAVSRRSGALPHRNSSWRAGRGLWIVQGFRRFMRDGI